MGPKMYVMYTKPLGYIIHHHGLNHHFYADDSQLYIKFNPKVNTAATEALTKIENCLTDIEGWMHMNKLKLNNEKTEVILFTSKHNIRHIDLQNMAVNMTGSEVVPASHVKNLGVTFDSTMCMERHVNTICRSAYAQLRNIGHIRRYLTNDATQSLMNGLVTSRLDYCNALLYGLPKSLIHKLQKVQNTAARIVTRTSRHSHITPVLQELHWLPIDLRIKFKVLLHTYKGLHGYAPGYITDILHI